MRYLVAYSADSGGRAALAVARLFAGDVTLTVVTITPETWGYPSSARVDAEYAQFLSEHAAKALEEARQFLGEDVEAEFLARVARSTIEGILDVIKELDAKMVILGSARSGPFGRFVGGSISDSLLHVAPVPVALAPRGYRPSRQTHVQRITCCFAGRGHTGATVAAAAELARRHKVPLRLVTGVVRDRQMYPAPVGWQSERLVEEQWRSDAAEAQRQILAILPEGIEATAELIDGPNWEEALDKLEWAEGEVLVIGSSRLGLGRTFLGSNATKIVRSSPVPTIVVPGAAGRS